jgi:hypothetical protein
MGMTGDFDLVDCDTRIRDARSALAQTGLIRLDERLGQMTPVNPSSQARLVAAAYNILAEAHRLEPPELRKNAN